MTTSMDPNQITIRAATIDDLDDITRVAQAGFPDDPEWNYRFPYRDSYPEDNWKWTRRDYRVFLSDTEKYKVLVATFSGNKSESNPTVIAVAVWNLNITLQEKDPGYDSGINKRRDVNKAHFVEFGRCLEHGLDKYFSRYKEKQYHLWLLTTHPDYRRRGAGTLLVKWGIERARARAWPATVLASPMGKLLYEQVGFREVGIVKAHVSGEKETLLVSCLTYDMMEHFEHAEI